MKNSHVKPSLLSDAEKFRKLKTVEEKMDYMLLKIFTFNLTRAHLLTPAQKIQMGLE
jgi:hypothetical protein